MTTTTYYAIVIASLLCSAFAIGLSVRSLQLMARAERTWRRVEEKERQLYGP